MNILDSLWSLVVAGSLRAGVLILAVLLLRVVLRERVPAQCFHLLWLLVALRLSLPVVPSSAWSVFNLFSKAEVADCVNAAPWRVRFSSEKTTAVSAPPVATKPVVVHLARRAPSVRQIVPLVWMLGIILQVAFLARSAVWMRRRLRGLPAMCDPRLDALLVECAARLGVSGKLRVVETDLVSGPAVMGFWRPRLLFPPGLVSRLSDEELRFVLLHECAHLRRRDLLALWVFTIARILHWFNPLVWIAARAARADTELACDETVLREAKAEQALAYGEALLRLAQMVAWRPSTLPAAGVVESQRAMHTRLARIARFSGKSHRQRWLPALIVIGAGLCFGAEEKVESPAPVEAPAATMAEPSAEVPEWARGWSIVWVSFPPRGSDSKPQVDFQKPDGTGLSLTGDGQTDDGVKLLEVAWVNSPKVTAVITLEKAGERAVLSALSDIVSRRGGESSKAAQIQVTSRFLEISETMARRLAGPQKPGTNPSQVGIELLGARLQGAPTVTILTGAQYRDLLQALPEKKGVDLLSAPSVTTKAGQRAIIEIIREFRYPVEWDAAPEVKGGWNPKSFETRNCGVTLEIDPTMNEAGAIGLKLTPQVVEFLGFRDIDSGKKYPARSMTVKSLAERFTVLGAMNKPGGARLQPVFSSRKIETEVTLLPGYAALIVGVVETENEAGFPSRAKSHRLSVLLSAATIDLQGSVVIGEKAAANPAPTPQEPPADMPKGVIVPDKPGFVRSPFAPGNGFIDVRGFPPGTQVRCPLTGKTFLIP